MIDDGALVRDLSQPENNERNGILVSVGGSWAEVELKDGGPAVSRGTLVGVQTSKTVYVGYVDSEENASGSQRLRVRVDHWLALQDVSSIQKLWSQEESN